MRIPRPDRSIVLGTPNACNACHASQPASWARDAIKTWFPSPKPGAQDFAEAFDLGDRRAPGAQRALLAVAGSGSSSTIARASAFARLANFPTPEALALAKHALTTDAPAVRAAAISVIAGTDAATKRSLLVPLLRDASRLVRMDAARALAGAAEIEILGDDRKAFHAALEEYEVGQLFNAERPESHANLGSLYIERGKPDQAREAFRRALDIDPRFVAAAVALADIERSAGNESAAEAGLREALKTSPRSGTVQHALALSLIRQRRMAEAMSLLSEAAENEPGNPRFGYVLAVAMHDKGRLSEAIQVLRRVLLRHPYDRDILLALASYELEANDVTAALERVKLLRELEPDRQDIARLLVQLLRRAR
jgi:Tfp pilus assembly protein PilF